MLEKGLIFLLGVFIAPVVKPVLTKFGRPLAREVIKLGLVAGEKVHQITQEVREEVEDLTAEAAMGLRTAKPEDPGTPRVQ